MWRHRRGFRGGGFFWIFGIMFVMGMLGKAGMPGFVIPIIFFWFLVPWLFRAGTRPYPREVHRPRQPVSQRDPAPLKEIRTSTHVNRRTVQLQQVHDLSQVPNSCRACGGPADETTVHWRGETPFCGYCGSRLEN